MGAKDFLEKLQAADEETKKRIIVVATAVIMTLIIFVWLSYFNNLVDVANEEPAAEVAVREEESSFFRSLGSGTASLFRGFTGMIRSFADGLGSREYVITPEKQK